MSKEYTKEDETSEGMTMKGEAKGMDKEFWESMTKGTGPLVAGALPGMDVVSEQAMAELFIGGSAAKAKAKKPTQKPTRRNRTSGTSDTQRESWFCNIDSFC